ncbi:MAG: UvrD-helicase domain-containing protein, partial [Alphaproteobacteria bacterium]|nr:UvrD-helicase domain-containing protein [Alphaproteobacteria bacterium]
PTESKVQFASRLMDDVTMKRLIKQAASELLNQSKGELQLIYTVFSRFKFNGIVEKILDEQAFFRFILMDGIDAFQEKLEEYINHPRLESDVLKEVSLTLNAFNFDRLSNIPESSENDALFIQSLLKALESQKLEALTDVLLTEKGTPRKRLVSKKVIDAYPDEAAQLFRLADEVFEWDQEIKRDRTVQSTVLVVKLASEFLAYYTNLKLDKGCLDYDDLIFKALEVLSDPTMAQHILYKLDRKIDHILVDEAQDTNIFQWKLIDCIVDGFFQNEDHKTIFVVGDHKQAIFGFQGTDPDIFHRIKSHYLGKSSLRSWNDISLDVSFRSMQTILDFVDAIFEHRPLIEEYSSHTAFHGAGGSVVVHPLCRVEEESGEDVYEIFANQVADEVKKLIGSEITHKGKPYRVHPRDILILIRRRGEHLDQLQRALSDRGIPFSAPNRQVMHEDHCVQFILQTITLIVQPLDHMSVMGWMLNPLLNMKTEGLMFAVQRIVDEKLLIEYIHDHPMFVSVMRAAEGYSSLEDLYLKISLWAADHLPVETYHISNVLTLFESLKVWQLNGDLKITYSELLAYIQTIPMVQVNRAEHDALRILTVHGAKGLQAPIVILADSTQLPIVRSVFVRDEIETMFLCTSDSQNETLEYKGLKERYKESQLKEYYRLLYVALTRAESQLHIFGATKTKVSDDSWYGLADRRQG